MITVEELLAKREAHEASGRNLPERSKLELAVSKLYANVNSYYWLPCPICRGMYGGHEHGNYSVICTAQGWSSGHMTCRRHDTTDSSLVSMQFLAGYWSFDDGVASFTEGQPFPLSPCKVCGRGVDLD